MKAIGVAAALLLAGLAAWGLLAAAEPRADFVVAAENQLRTVDPQRVSYLDEIQIAQALFEGLTRIDPDTQQPEPAVAESWQVSGDQLTWTFRLRPEARWSNGEPVLADHFRFAWLRALDPANESQYASLLLCVRGAEAWYQRGRGAEGSRGRGAEGAGKDANDASTEADAGLGVRVIDEHTLEVTLAAPTPFLPELLALPVFAPLWPPLIEQFAWRDGRVLRRTRHLWTRPEHIVCNGAFTLERWDFKQRLLLRRNEHYWDRGRIALGNIEIYLAGSGNAGLVAYQTGRVDLLRGLETEAARAVLVQQEHGRRDDFHVSDRFATYFFRVNCRRPPLDDADLRAALSLTIDRERLCEHVLGLGERPATTFVPTTAIRLMPRAAADGSTVYYEPPAGLGDGLSAAERAARARELFAQRRDAATPLRPIEISFVPELAVNRRVAEAVAEMWRAVLGVEVELRAQEAKVLSERIRRLDYDIVPSNWFGDYLDPSAFLDLFTAGNGQNRTGWADERYDALIAAARGETDARRRFGLYHDAEALLVRGGVPIVPLYFMRGNYLLNPRIEGLRDSVLGVLPIQAARVRIER